LIESLPKVFAWLLSFSVIALFWMVQQKLYRYATTLDRTLVRIELAIYGSLVTAAALHAAHMVLISLLALLRVWHFERHPELHIAEFSPAIARAKRIGIWIFAGCSRATLVLAFVIPGYSMLAMVPACLAPLVARE